MDFNTFSSIRIGLASPDKIKNEWSYGEVKKPETINYRTLKPEPFGLYCERIFGPTKDWECHCGKYKRIRHKGVICDRCGVEVTRSKVRRERMGHIELAAPVSHIWYVKGIPSRIGLMLDISPSVLEKILYFAQYVVLDVDEGIGDLKVKQPLTEKEYNSYVEKYGNHFRADMGAEAIKELLERIDLDELSTELREEMKASSGQKKAKVAKRLELVESFRKSNNRPEWMIMDVVPVIPPDIRPLIQLDGGRFATSDLNDLYRRVINRNNRLKKLLELGAPSIIVRNEKRMLQEAVDALIDNGRRGRPVTGAGNRALKSLSDMLKGKQGRFRQNLLGKRVDYSGRSVIVVGPDLKIYQCGLPKEMAIELFKPFVMKKLVESGAAHNIKSAKRMVERTRVEVWDVLEGVIKDHPVMLNRAPTLHRLGIQAFEPVLVEGKAIRLHPLVCTAFNADFDGDQMAVHVPLSPEAQAEARFLMLSANNLLKPQDGGPVTVPTQDMVLGSYYLTIIKEDEPGVGKEFASITEAMLAYDAHYVGLHSRIKVRVGNEDYYELKFKRFAPEQATIECTVGQLIFNANVPQDINLYVSESEREQDHFKLEVTKTVTKSVLSKIIDKCIKVHGTTRTSEVLDAIKDTGYKFSTRGAITISVSDMAIPGSKKEYLAAAEEQIEGITKLYRRGLITDDERYNSVIKTWQDANDKVTKALIDNLGEFNPIYMMATSGARGSINQIRQLAGMRGLMANTSGRTVEIPIRSSFREGLNILEYFISTHGARKGLTDTALRTADSGYLTRRLVDVSQDVIIRELDCGTNKGIVVSAIYEGKEEIEPLSERLVGRVAIEDIAHPETGEIIVKAGTMMNSDMAKAVDDARVKEVLIRSVLACRAKIGVCATCYGANLARGGEPVNIGEAVGIIAAQSIGEPGTQLTMRTFHAGGVAGDDITQGLPRVEELFEARKPKGVAIVTDISGVVTITRAKGKTEIIITNDETMESQTIFIPYGATIKVADGDRVEAADPLTTGSINPHDILRIKGVEAVQQYLVKEVQKVYRSQGVDISDKHIEVIIRQMIRKVKIESEGDSDYLVGDTVDRLKFPEIVAEFEAAGKEPPQGKELLLGITKAALATDSFLSAASFQETTRVLTDAAIKGKTDPLVGLKENVIIGKLIPAGTGVPMYRDLEIDVDEEAVGNKLTIPDLPIEEDDEGITLLEEDNDDELELTGDELDFDDEPEDAEDANADESEEAAAVEE
ncbi:MAG: DNA-directed RNA polymerase subunit beta' [Clostridia bacterium]|nr:DNA-directed RNA polymerase subunit beta' [Clostridia bacterium]